MKHVAVRDIMVHVAVRSSLAVARGESGKGVAGEFVFMKIPWELNVADSLAHVVSACAFAQRVSPH